MKQKSKTSTLNKGSNNWQIVRNIQRTMRCLLLDNKHLCTCQLLPPPPPSPHKKKSKPEVWHGHSVKMIKLKSGNWGHAKQFYSEFFSTLGTLYVRILTVRQYGHIPCPPELWTFGHVTCINDKCLTDVVTVGMERLNCIGLSMIFNYSPDSTSRYMCTAVWKGVRVGEEYN